jgi:hypothetical protein
MRVFGISLALLVFAARATCQVLDDESLRKMKVVSGRSHAMMQFNMPEVQLWLPRVPNSAYAVAEFGPPKLVDAKGRPVQHEVEQGIYNGETFETEIRFETKGAPARASGTIHVHYPTRIRKATRSDSSDQLVAPATFVHLPRVIVEQWKEVDITYDLPVIAKLPDSANGIAPPVPQTITATPGGKVVITLAGAK